MAEVVGIIASVAQLAECIIKMISALSKALEWMKKKRPEMLEGKTEKILRLKDIAETVRKNTMLHTEVIELQLLATIGMADSLRRVIRKVTIRYTTGSFRRRFRKAIQNNAFRSFL